jgi:SAM-dependent methyltransferase
VQHHEVTKLADLEHRHWWYAERRAVLARQLKRLGRPRPGDKALDIGAAAGGNSAVLEEHGYTVVAADLSTTAVGLARDRGVKVLNADIRSLPLQTGSINLVTALDVLEHVHEDYDAIGEINRVLKPGGTALITVPASMSLWSSHDEAVGHVRRYSQEELLKLVDGAGLQVAKVWSWNVLLRPVVALRRKKSSGSDLEQIPSLVNMGLRAIVAAERFLPVKTLPGVSLVLIAHKPA